MLPNITTQPLLPPSRPPSPQFNIPTQPLFPKSEESRAERYADICAIVLAVLFVVGLIVIFQQDFSNGA